MGGSQCCIVACIHLGNGTDHRTVTLMAPLSHYGPAKYEAWHHSKKKVCWYFCVFSRRDVCRGRSRFNQIICESMLHMEGQARYVGVAGCCRGRLSVYWREYLQERTGINPGCSWIKHLGQDSAGDARKEGITR